MSGQRCSFCGFSADFPHRHRPIAWQDIGGRLVCDADCAEKDAARQAAEPAPRLLAVDEIGAARVVDQAAWAAEHRREAGMGEGSKAPVDPAELEAQGPAGVEIALAWLEEHAPDAVDDLKLLGARRFGGDTPHAFIVAAYKREVQKRADQHTARAPQEIQ
ncbi:hypothetical protein [Sorangium sp. So ce233]|uniref:hypothetical protein n=1 Tax=Sorangium sp. So ce233 TaxID=3133290 RepID=UPI003F62EA59